MKKVISLILTLFLTFNVSVFADDTKTEEKDPAKTYESYIVDQSVATVKNRYVFDDVTELDMYRNALRQVLYKNPELLDEALKGIFNNLDPNSEYYTKEEYDLFMQNLLNELCGIGVIVSEHDDGLLVSKVLKNTPASRSNLKRYDVIIAVDDISISGMSIDQAKTYIVGEKGTDVKLTVMRNGEKIDITMQRDTFVTEMGYYQVIETAQSDI